MQKRIVCILTLTVLILTVVNRSEADTLNMCEIFWAGDSTITFLEDLTNSVLGVAVRNPPSGYAIEPWVDNNECFLSYGGRTLVWWNSVHGSCDLYNQSSETYFDCFSFYNTKHVIVQLGVNDISLLSEAYDGNVDVALSAAIDLIQNIQSLGKKVIWVAAYPLDKDGLKDNSPYEIPEVLPEGAGEFGQGKIDCTPDMSPRDCRRYWNSNYEYFIDRLNPWCEDNNVGFINVFQYIRDACGDANTDDFIEAYSKDGIHIKYPGSEIMYSYIRAELETMLSYDVDNDAIRDCNDNCPSVHNPGQDDADEDEIGDLCDSCTHDPSNDSDSDTLCGDIDNCPHAPNANQEDSYPPQGNGIGDACECEGNFDCDSDTDGSDASALKADFGRSSFQRPCGTGDPCKGDFSCDGDVDGTDASLFKQDFGRSRYKNPCPARVKGVEWCGY